MSHTAQVPEKVAEYQRKYIFPAVPVLNRTHPTVAQTFRPGVGWKKYPGTKRVSAAWARKAKSDGVTDVALNIDGHIVDFPIGDLLWRKANVGLGVSS